MREIKFRAWDKKRKKMFLVTRIQWDVYQSEIIEVECVDWPTGIYHYIIPEEEDTGLPNPEYNLNDLELMQFTGLKDKKGVEIYEGDIIKFGKISLIVEWSEKISSFMGRPNGKLRDWPSLTEHSAAKHGVILGNIYENNELLEAEG